MIEEISIWCVAALLLGIVFGYVLNWAIRHNPQPDAKELAALAAVVAGGVVIGLVHELLSCPTAVAWYVIGLAVGFFLYLVALHFNWDKIVATFISKGRGVPLFPWSAK